MSTKRERSVTPDNTAATSSPSPGSVRPRAAPAEITAQRIPPLDLSDPRKWLNELDQWCDRNNIHDDWVKYSLIATTQTPGEYAVLRSSVRDFSQLDPYTVARRHIMRQRISPLPETIDNGTPLRNDTDTNGNVPASGDTGATETEGASAENAPHEMKQRPTSTPRHIENNEENSTLPPPPGRTVYQVENALSRQIDALQMANAEIRIEIAALRRTADPDDTADTRRRRTTPITNAANGPVDTSLCWYHQTYGTQARLCRSPCRLRRPAPAAP